MSDCPAVGLRHETALAVVSLKLSFVAHRLKNQRKAVVTAVNKKVPNGILEEQGNCHGVGEELCKNVRNTSETEGVKARVDVCN